MARRSVKVRDLARAAVLRTGEWPGFSVAYRGVYRMQIERARRALVRVSGVRAVWVRGSDPERVRPGLSDIDLVVLLEPGPGEQRLTTLEALFLAIRRVNRGAPLIRDVHAGTPRAFEALARSASGLHAAIAHDCVLIVGDSPFPVGSTDALLVGETSLREAWYWSTRAVQQIGQPGLVARALAARSHAKALAALSAIDRGVSDLSLLTRAYAEKELVPLDRSMALSLLHRSDAALPSAPAILGEEASAHPNIVAATRDVRSVTADLIRCPAIESVVLSVEGPRENDLRCYVVFDPRHPDAEDALGRIAAVEAKGALPFRWFSRFSSLLAVSRSGLERSVFLRCTALEPIARMRHGVVIAGRPVVARASADELGRALGLEAATAAIGVNELVASGARPRTTAALADVAWGLAPAVRALSRQGAYRTRYDPEAPASAHDQARIAASSRRFRVELLETLEHILEHDHGRLAGLEDGRQIR